MTKIKTIIIDDERLARELIKEYLAGHSGVEIVGECRDAHEAISAIQQLQPDLIFLDIQMPEINGFELLEMLDDIPYIIFSTAYDQYAIKAFDVNAIDYLLKPYDEERFNIALNRAIRQIQANENSADTIKELIRSVAKPTQFLTRLLIKDSGKIYIINCSDIIYVEAMDDYVHVHTSKNSYLMQQSMNSLEARLNPDQFIRAHRSYIVNIDAIKEIIQYSQGSYKIELNNNKVIALSRTGIKNIKRFSI